jgi:hypothetical protein
MCTLRGAALVQNYGILQPGTPTVLYTVALQSFAATTASIAKMQMHQLQQSYIVIQGLVRKRMTCTKAGSRQYITVDS